MGVCPGAAHAQGDFQGGVDTGGDWRAAAPGQTGQAALGAHQGRGWRQQEFGGFAAHG